MILHLGILDLPYAHQGSKGGKVSSGQQTTGFVAEILENKYHVMEQYFLNNQEQVAGALENSAAGALENLLVGGPVQANPFAEASSNIERGFKDWLARGQIERLGYPGIPTQAALNRRSLRRKSKKGPRRPSFIDTGLYQSAFKAWVD